MIDVHAHVLPGVDDGPATWEESLRMCRQAVEDGTTTLVATPHITPGVYPNHREGIVAGVAELAARLAAEEIPLAVVPSAEVWLDPALLLDGDGVIPYLGEARRFVLLHFPPRLVLRSVSELVYTLASRGVTPIVTHPERHCQLQGDPEQLRALVAAGALSQVTASSLAGKFGRTSAAAARRFLELGLVHLIGSDAHSVDHRPPILSEGVAVAALVVGQARARAMVTEAPRAVLAGRLPDLAEPDPPVGRSPRGLLCRLFPRATAG